MRLSSENERLWYVFLDKADKLGCGVDIHAEYFPVRTVV